MSPYTLVLASGVALAEPGWGGLEEAWTAEGDAEHDHFGDSVGTVGDVNGDGYADVGVGAHGYGETGRARVYFGGPSGLGVVEGWAAVPPIPARSSPPLAGRHRPRVTSTPTGSTT